MEYLKKYDAFYSDSDVIKKSAKRDYENGKDNIEFYMKVLETPYLYNDELIDILMSYDAQKHMLEKFPELSTLLYKKSKFDDCIQINPKIRNEFDYLFDSNELGLLESTDINLDKFKTWLIIKKETGRIVSQSYYFYDIMQKLCGYVAGVNYSDAKNEARNISDDFYDKYKVDEDVDEMNIEFDQPDLDEVVYDFLERQCRFKRKTKDYCVWSNYRVIRKDIYEMEHDMTDLGLLESKQLSLFDESELNKTFGTLKEDDEIYEDFNKLFQLASETGDEEIIKMFVDKGGDANYEDILANTLDAPDMFKYLIENGAEPENIDTSSTLNKSLLKDEEILKILLDNNHFDWIKKNNLDVPDSIKEDPEYEYIFGSEEIGLL